MSSAGDTVSFEGRGGVARLTLSRPDRHNAVDLELLAAFGRTLERVEADVAGLRALVLTGAGRSFCSGADLREIGSLDVARARSFMLDAAWTFRRLERLPVPVVAAVRGYCLGGGFELALHCDVIVAAEDAQFGFPEPSIGLITTTGAVDRLMQTVGMMRARELLLSGRRVGAEEASRLGLVTRVVASDALERAVDEQVAVLVRNAPAGVAAVKAILRERIDAGARSSWIGEAEAFEQLFRARASRGEGSR